ncbi:MAG: hypothetical protein LBT97_08320 [Planctomycetota bacterium]|jgi:hypothetical protein|nr:hypothetical protein [Planctomycetota bacterium]
MPNATGINDWCEGVSAARSPGSGFTNFWNDCRFPVPAYPSEYGGYEARRFQGGGEVIPHVRNCAGGGWSENPIPTATISVICDEIAVLTLFFSFIFPNRGVFQGNIVRRPWVPAPGMGFFVVMPHDFRYHLKFCEAAIKPPIAVSQKSKNTRAARIVIFTNWALGGLNA